MYKKFILTGALCGALALSGCAQMKSQWDSFSEWWQPTEAITSVIKPYRPTTHQGNLITKEMVEQLHLGMTQQQVQFLLGVPLLRDMFHQNRWDYVYYMNPRFGDPEHRRLTVYFDDAGRLSRYEFTPMPEETLADQIILGTEKEFHAEKNDLTVVDYETEAQEDVQQAAQ
ncbi:MAG: outer membrane protein assembly factor BamE [Candidatus Aphodousia sp.]|nr:outer membrane protein assembly factor BamE [Sutterella sp.]MDY2900266.1 outer membrane protein assembly factor BamE [Candidatus Aphodousia sp.]